MMIDRVGSQGADPMHGVIADYNKTMDLGRMLSLTDAYAGCCSETTNYFPIYMLMQFDTQSADVEKQLGSFWRKKNNYTVIMRLHQKCGSEHELFRSLLLKRLEDSNKASPECPIEHLETVAGFYSKLKVIDENQISYKVDCVFYDSLELGDVIGVIKGDSMWAMLHVQRWLYESRHVSDAYSYCGIRYNLLLDEKISNEIKAKLPATKLDYVETRFSVRDVDDAWNFLDEHSVVGYCVTGSADALLHYEELSEIALLEHMCRLVHYDKMYDAFNDVVTRIGVKNRKPLSVATEVPLKATSSKKIELNPELVSWISLKYKESNHPEGEIYAHSLEKLVSSLDAMHSNSVTDALSELMYDGINALLEQLEYYRETNYWHENLSEILQEFLDQWSSTTNEILHLESQLFQHPELVPVRFYIPAMVLQFQSLIVAKAMGVLHQIDDALGSQYIPIMLPKSQSNTVTKAILDPKELAEYNGKSPLCIYIPIHMLYHPYRVSLILCHEIAHYCGHKIRNRELRNEIMKKCISFYATARMISCMGVLNENVEDNGTVFSKLMDCTRKMENYFDHLVTGNIKEGFLDDVTTAVSQNIGPMITSPQVLNDLVRILLDGWDAATQLRICDKIELEGYDKYANLVMDCQEHLKHCLDSLLRECFADVVMILLSDCTFNDYYTCMFHDEFRNLEEKQYSIHEDKQFIKARFYESHTDRMALVACCIDTVRSGWSSLTDKNQNDELWQQITREKVAFWNQFCKNKNQPLLWKKSYKRTEGCAFTLTGYEAEQILNYLNKCAREIRFKIQPVPVLQPIKAVRLLREQIGLMHPDQMDWNRLQQILKER